MSSITHYVGKVENKRIFLICENEKGQKVQVPHIDFMTEQGLTAVAYHDVTLKQPYKFLNTLELARFMTGRDIEGSNKTFTVTGTETDRFYTESGSYVEKIYFTAIDEDNHSFTISPNRHLYIQEVTK